MRGEQRATDTVVESRRWLSMDVRAVGRRPLRPGKIAWVQWAAQYSGCRWWVRHQQRNRGFVGVKESEPTCDGLAGGAGCGGGGFGLLISLPRSVFFHNSITMSGVSWRGCEISYSLGRASRFCHLRRFLFVWRMLWFSNPASDGRKLRAKAFPAHVSYCPFRNHIVASTRNVSYVAT